MFGYFNKERDCLPKTVVFCLCFKNKEATDVFSVFV